MTRALPVLTVLAIILGVWYAATVWMNAPQVRQAAARAGVDLTTAEVVARSMSENRPMLAAPHQVAAELWKGVTGQPITSRRSLVWHGWITLQATLTGFALGILLGVGLAVAIVYSRVMDAAVMPWAVISQTIPIVALAPMIVVLSNSLGLGERLGVENRLVSKTLIAAYLSFFPVLVGMVKGLRSPDAMQTDLLRTWNASGAQEFVKLRLPASMPYFFASLKVAIAAALVGAIVGELPTGAVEGLGARMLVASQFGQPLLAWAALFAAAILAGMLIVAVGAMQRAADRRMGVRG
ncbi:MAG TPA: ABC transporter permease [Paracoccaceae bacterium]|nr:ABC transporter permease [Paracoccaceae bacterium]HMO73148.1 ABC transporter permease [Paracoccaceae bacterium]